MSLISNEISGYMSKASFIRKMFERGIELKKQFGAENVFDFSLGNPDLPPPREVAAELRNIADDLDQIVLALDRCLGAAGKRPEGIDRVFLTGGTAFVPAVREIFEDTFGESKLSGGGELTSVATGLARLAATAHG